MTFRHNFTYSIGCASLGSDPCFPPRTLSAWERFRTRSKVRQAEARMKDLVYRYQQWRVLTAI